MLCVLQRASRRLPQIVPLDSGEAGLVDSLRQVLVALVGALDQHVDDAQQAEGRPYRTSRLMRGADARLDPPVEQRVLVLCQEVASKVAPEGHQPALLQHVVQRVEGGDVVVLLVELFGGLGGSDC